MCWIALLDTIIKAAVFREQQYPNTVPETYRTIPRCTECVLVTLGDVTLTLSPICTSKLAASDSSLFCFVYQGPKFLFDIPGHCSPLKMPLTSVDMNWVRLTRHTDLVWLLRLQLQMAVMMG